MNMILRSLIVAVVSSCSLFPATYPVYDGYVTDSAGILDGAYHDYLEKLLTALDTRTTAQIAVAIIPSLEGEDLASYNVELFRKWNVGRAGKDNGILFLIAVKERRMRIQTGHGLKDALPDAAAKNILHNTVRPLFKASKMTEGITDGTEAIADAAAKKYGITRTSLGVERPSRQAADMVPVETTISDGAPKHGNGTPWILIVLVIAVTIVIVVIIRRYSGKAAERMRAGRGNSMDR
ncbi:MAG: TPM domain-containing protein [Spirochaetota bacterium]